MNISYLNLNHFFEFCLYLIHPSIISINIFIIVVVIIIIIMIIIIIIIILINDTSFLFWWSDRYEK